MAVLGGGNGSLAAALDLTEQGHSVRLWRRDPDTVASMVASDRTITLKDFNGARPVQIDTITSDLGAAIDGVALIVAVARWTVASLESSSTTTTLRSLQGGSLRSTLLRQRLMLAASL